MRKIKNITMDPIRMHELCENRGYYTAGDIGRLDYERTFRKIEPDMTLEQVRDIARDILEHSDQKHKEAVASAEEGICLITQQLLDECCLVRYVALPDGVRSVR